MLRKIKYFLLNKNQNIQIEFENYLKLNYRYSTQFHNLSIFQIHLYQLFLRKILQHKVH